MCFKSYLGSHPPAQGIINNPQPNDGDEFGSRGRGQPSAASGGKSDLLALLQGVTFSHNIKPGPTLIYWYSKRILIKMILVLAWFERSDSSSKRGKRGNLRKRKEMYFQLPVCLSS